MRPRGHIASTWAHCLGIACRLIPVRKESRTYWLFTWLKRLAHSLRSGFVDLLQSVLNCIMLLCW